MSGQGNMSAGTAGTNAGMTGAAGKPNFYIGFEIPARVRDKIAALGCLRGARSFSELCSASAVAAVTFSPPSLPAVSLPSERVATRRYLFRVSRVSPGTFTSVFSGEVRDLYRFSPFPFDFHASAPPSSSAGSASMAAGSHSSSCTQRAPLHLPPPRYLAPRAPRLAPRAPSTRAAPRPRGESLSSPSIAFLGGSAPEMKAVSEADERRAGRALAAVRAALAGRRVWLMDALWDRMPEGTTRQAFRSALQLLCYRFRDGPWRTQYVARGYDPRGDPRAAETQVVDMRWKDHERTFRQPEGAEGRWYTLSAPPTGVQCVYGLVHLLDVVAEKGVHVRAEVDAPGKTHGWLSRQTYEMIRRIIAERVDELFT